MNLPRGVAALHAVRSNPRTAVSLASGVLDVGFASLAGFCATFYAARFFELDQLGLFSVFFVLFQFLGFVPARLINAPAQVLALDAPVSERVAAVRYTFLPAVTIGLATAPLVWLALILTPGHARADYVAFGVTTAGMVVVSPIQDHARVMLHMARRSGAAVVVSAVQFSVALVCVLALHFSEVPGRWVPFSALVIANCSSLTVAFLLIRHQAATATHIRPTLARMLGIGWLLLPAQILRPLGMLGASVLVVRFASVEALGEAEASRVAVAPLLVMTMGLGRVVGPRLMEAGRERDTHRLLTVAQLYVAVLTGTMLLFVAVFGWPHQFNALELLLPLAFATGGLVAVRAVAATVVQLGTIPGGVLVAVEDNRGLLVTAILGLAFHLSAAALLAPTFGAFALPLSEIVGEAALFATRLPRVRRALAARSEVGTT